MADVYLTTNSGFAASDVILRTSAISVAAAPAGGTLRRHQGKSTGPDRQVQRFVNFQWTFTATIAGTTSTPLARRPPRPTITSGQLHAATTTRTVGVHVTGQLATTSRVNPPMARMWPDDDDDLLVLLL